MSREWFYQSMGKERGPHTPAEMRQAAANGAIGPDTQVKLGRDGKWVKAEGLETLFDDEPASAQPQEVKVTLSRIDVPFRDILIFTIKSTIAGILVLIPLYALVILVRLTGWLFDRFD